MAWTKPITGTETARVANQDLELRLYFGDAASTPPNALRTELTVKTDATGGVVTELKSDRALIDSSLTPAERTALTALLLRIRDDGLAELGFVNS